MIHMQLVYLYIKSAIRILVITFVILGLSKIAYALEVDFPAFGGIEPTDSFGPAQWISYIFQFSLAAVGLALIYSFSRAGLEWMFSDSITNKKDAIDRIKNAVLGFVLLLGSYIVLNTINPNLTDIQNPTVEGILNITGNPNGTGEVGECNDSTECVIGEVCIDKITGMEIFGVSEEPDDAVKLGTCEITGEEGEECSVSQPCFGEGSACVDTFGTPVTGSENGACTTLKTNNELCANNAECSSGRCEPGVGTGILTCRSSI